MTRCSDLSRERSDHLAATAPPTRGWLLLELPGPWGPRGLMDSRLSHSVAKAVAARADTAGLRILLIRRAGRAAQTDDVRRWAIAEAASGRTSWGHWAAEQHLVDGPLPGSDPDDVTTVDSPTYLVCTHGKHDVCCAVRGRPVAQAMAAVRRNTWECSHVGGDRFAANVVVLPWGLYYGRVDADEVGRLAELTDSSRLLVPRFRGRTGVPLPAQAAQQHARTASGLDGRDALAVNAVEQIDDDHWSVDLVGQPTLVVSRHRLELPEGLTCAGVGPSAVWRWTVESAAVTAI